MFSVSSQGRDDKSLRAKKRTLEQTLPWSFQPSKGRAAEGNLGQDPGSLCSRPSSGPDSLGHCLLVMSLFSTSVFHLYSRKNESSSHQLACESTWGSETMSCLPDLLFLSLNHSFGEKLLPMLIRQLLYAVYGSGRSMCTRHELPLSTLTNPWEGMQGRSPRIHGKVAHSHGQAKDSHFRSAWHLTSRCFQKPRLRTAWKSRKCSPSQAN